LTLAASKIDPREISRLWLAIKPSSSPLTAIFLSGHSDNQIVEFHRRQRTSFDIPARVRATVAGNPPLLLLRYPAEKNQGVGNDLQS
jgi:hypothetical protein